MDLEETRAFLAVLDHGSFKAAAENLNQPRATLRRRVESLEVRAGVPLLDRSRNGVEPTAAGAVLARHGRALLRETDALLHVLRELDDDTPRGTLRVGIPSALPGDGVALVFGLFRAKFPQLRLDIRVADDPVCELVDEVDVILQLGDQAPPSRWSTIPLARLREGLFASAGYLERRGTPRTLEQLAEHELLACGAPGEHRWPLTSGGGVGIEPAMVMSDAQHLRRFAGFGFGIALLPDIDFGEDDDALTPVLGDVVGRWTSLNAVVPEVLAETPKLKAILGHLERCFSRGREQRVPPTHLAAV